MLYSPENTVNFLIILYRLCNCVLPGSYVGGGGGGNGPPSFMTWVYDLAARMVAINSSCFLRQFDCFLGGSGWKTWNVQNCYVSKTHFSETHARSVPRTRTTPSKTPLTHRCLRKLRHRVDDVQHNTMIKTGFFYVLSAFFFFFTTSPFRNQDRKIQIQDPLHWKLIPQSCSSHFSLHTQLHNVQ